MLKFVLTTSAIIDWLIVCRYRQTISKITFQKAKGRSCLILLDWYELNINRLSQEWREIGIGIYLIFWSLFARVKHITHILNLKCIFYFLSMSLANSPRVLFAWNSPFQTSQNVGFQHLESIICTCWSLLCKLHQQPTLTPKRPAELSVLV